MCGTEYRESSEVMARVLVDQCAEREVLELNIVVIGGWLRLRVQRMYKLSFHWQLSMDTQNILKDFVSVM